MAKGAQVDVSSRGLANWPLRYAVAFYIGGMINPWVMRDDLLQKYKKLTSFKIPSNTKRIMVNDDIGFIVDDDDYQSCLLFKWHLKPNKNILYVVRTVRPDADLPNGCASRKLAVHRHLIGDVHGLVIDHINGNTLDNRRSNLRHVSQRINALNRHSMAALCLQN